MRRSLLHYPAPFVDSRQISKRKHTRKSSQLRSFAPNGGKLIGFSFSTAFVEKRTPFKMFIKRTVPDFLHDPERFFSQAWLSIRI
jgi:hypothetical protein